MIEKIKNVLPAGTRWFDILESRGTAKSISFKNSRMYSVTERETSGRGVRVNIGGRTGLYYSNRNGSPADLARRAAELSQFGDNETFRLPEKIHRTFDPYRSAIRNFDLAGEIGGAEGIIAAIHSEFPEASADISVTSSEGSVRIANSSGADASYRHSRYSIGITVTCVLDDGTRIEVWEGSSSLEPERPAGLISGMLDSLRLAGNKIKIPSGSIPVIFTPKAFSQIIGILLAGLNGRTVFKGISPFADKAGQKLFNAGFSLTDDPLMPGSPSSYPFDDEGVAGQTKEIISHGVIRQFITDLNHAAKLGTQPGGNGSRGYSSLPVPSFSNVLVREGSAPFNELLRNAGGGILVDQFIGLGQSNTLTGDFSAGLDLAFAVENGGPAARIKDCMISDNLFTLLSGDMIISRERKRYGSTVSPFVLFPSVSFTG